MYTGTSEPCVGLAHLIGAFPRIAAALGCLAVGTYFFPVLTQQASATCLAQNGQVITDEIEGSVCIVPPTAELLFSDL